MAATVRWALVVGVTVALLATVTDVAFALRSLQFSNPGAFRATGRLSFEDEAGFLRVVCESFTLSGELNERIAKVIGATGGSSTRGETAGCRAFGFVAARVIINAETRNPFRKIFQAILGTLPEIRGILYTDNIDVTVEAGERICRYRGDWELLIAVVRLAWAGLTELPANVSLQREASSGSCPSRGSFVGTTLNYERSRTVRLV